MSEIVVLLSRWTSHYNQLLYSFLFYSSKVESKFTIRYSESVPVSGVVLLVNGRSCFLDYSDAPSFLANPEEYDVYFKRSLPLDCSMSGVFPLNFQVNFSYKPFKLLSKMPFKVLVNKKSRVEVARSLDRFSFFTNDSHWDKNIEHLHLKVNDNGGRVIFMTRLWDPYRTGNVEERERRLKQNKFRINACRVILKNFPNSLAGVYPDYYAKENAEDVLLDLKSTRKANYFRELEFADIGVADDGLKDTPGWKIGEYLMFKKAIISTPINVFVENFEERVNYLKTNSRIDFERLPELIEFLLTGRKYLDFKAQNRLWYEKYLRPDSYVENILRRIVY